MKKRPPIPYKVKSKLQKEADSECPFLSNQDIECFEVHHIDENPENNDFENLLFLCANCHTKITKRDISIQEVKRIKSGLAFRMNKVEFVSAFIDSENCSWELSNENEYAFFNTGEESKSPFPIINFTFINHSSRTIILKRINLKAKFLPRGISGIPKASVLKPLTKFQIQITEENNFLNLSNPIQVPSDIAFFFQIELSKKSCGEIYEIKGRVILNFSFEFSNSITLTIPKLFLNCTSDEERFKISTLSNETFKIPKLSDVFKGGNFIEKISPLPGRDPSRNIAPQKKNNS